MMAFSREAAKQQTVSILAKDSGGGFFLQDDVEGCDVQSNQGPSQTSNSSASSSSTDSSRVHCLECFDPFHRSFLRTHFNYDVCDGCRDDRGKHSLITRTEAKTEFVLKDCDLDQREPILKCITKRNPHEFAKGDMKLYLRCQVLSRAVMVHGSEEAIEAEKERRGVKRKQLKQKKFNKKLQELRMNVRSSLYTKDLDKNHEHDFDEEVCVDEDEDLYEKKCKSCGQVMRYEKL